MNPYFRQVRSLLRLVGAGAMLVGALDLAFYWASGHRLQVPLDPWRCVTRAIPLVLGLLVVWKSGPWARRLTRDFDD